MKPLALVIATCTLVACNQSTPPAAPTSAQAPEQPPAAQQPAPAPPPAPAPTPAPTPPAAPEVSVPARFHGTWASDTAACGASGHESRLVVDADSLQFHESSGRVTSVAANGDDLSVGATLTGEGQSREASYRFSLSNGGDTLTDRDSGMVRKRCGA